MVTASGMKGFCFENMKSRDEIKEEHCFVEVVGVILIHTDIVY